ncbi:hypothetical protein TKK_0000350 [Trichogramma kaykai]
MIVFLNRFVEMWNDIISNGIPCIIKNKKISITPFILSVCVDAFARAPMQGMKQFNGYYGCNWCLHPGVYDDVITYTLQNHPICKRTHENTIELMLNTNIENINYGVRYASPLINLPHFNIIEGFVPDYLHSCLEGVAK